MSTVQAIYNGTQGKNIGSGTGHEGASKKRNGFMMYFAY